MLTIELGLDTKKPAPVMTHLTLEQMVSPNQGTLHLILFQFSKGFVSSVMATNYVSLLFLNSILPISIQLHSSRISSKSNHIHNKLKSHLLYILDRLVSLMSFIPNQLKY